MSGRYLLFYDEDCGLCSFMSRWVRRIDAGRRVDVVPMGSPEADPHLAGLGDARYDSMHVLTPSGERAGAGLAMLRLLEAMPLVSGMGRLLASRERGRVLSEAAYLVLVRVRDGLAT